MNTKTMRLPPRRVLNPDKRKETERLVKQPSIPAPFRKPNPAQFGSPRAAYGAKAKPVASNQLLAGYLAHEVLSKGTLFGEPWLDPARAQLAPLPASSAKPICRAEPVESSEMAPEPDLKRRRYEDVARLVRADGTHLPGIVNPTLLARFLKL